MKKSEVNMACVLLLAAIFQCFWHWLISTRHPAFTGTLHQYTWHDPKSGKGFAGWIDVTLPCILLGFVVGRVGSEWRKDRFLTWIFVVASVMTSLLAAYPALVCVPSLWWWPQSRGSQLNYIALKLVENVVLVAAAAFLTKSPLLATKLHDPTKIR